MILFKKDPTKHNLNLKLFFNLDVINNSLILNSTTLIFGEVEFEEGILKMKCSLCVSFTLFLFSSSNDKQNLFICVSVNGMKIRRRKRKLIKSNSTGGMR